MNDSEQLSSPRSTLSSGSASGSGGGPPPRLVVTGQPVIGPGSVSQMNSQNYIPTGYIKEQNGQFSPGVTTTSSHGVPIFTAQGVPARVYHPGMGPPPVAPQPGPAPGDGQRPDFAGRRLRQAATTEAANDRMNNRPNTSSRRYYHATFLEPGDEFDPFESVRVEGRWRDLQNEKTRTSAAAVDQQQQQEQQQRQQNNTSMNDDIENLNDEDLNSVNGTPESQWSEDTTEMLHFAQQSSNPGRGGGGTATSGATGTSSSGVGGPSPPSSSTGMNSNPHSRRDPARRTTPGSRSTRAATNSSTHDPMTPPDSPTPNGGNRPGPNFV
ncbi:unnamed protein product [Amoebophrya sp. A120]|nr:unnamed protein product [Amoebophrya sp. A120]|eukprot:GSA120T00000006001.1